MIDETDETLIESLADNFLSSLSSQTTGLDEAEKVGRLAYKYAILLGRAKGWKPRTREEIARHVQRRVEWRLTQHRRAVKDIDH